MKQKTILKQVTNLFENHFGMSCDSAVNDDGGVIISAEGKINAYKDQAITITILAYENGMSFITFDFGEVNQKFQESDEGLLDILTLLNGINANEIFKACINSDAHICLELDIHNVVSESNLTDTIGAAMVNIVDEDFKPILEQIYEFL